MSTACNPRSTSQINHLASYIAGAEGWVHTIRDEGVSLGRDCWRKEIYDDAVWIDECFFYAPPRRSSTQLMDVDGVEDLALQSRASRWTPPDPCFPGPPPLDPVATGEGPSQQLNRMTHQTRSLSSSIRILAVRRQSRLPSLAWWFLAARAHQWPSGEGEREFTGYRDKYSRDVEGETSAWMIGCGGDDQFTDASSLV